MPHSLTDLSGLPVDSEGFLTAVLAAVAQPIWVVDPDGLIRFANPAAIAALGYDSPDELFGCRSHETIHYKHPDGSPFPASECPLLLPRTTGETVARGLDWFVRRDGSMLPVSYVSVPLEMANGRGAVVAFTDIQDRLRAERVLREHDATLARQLASLRRVATLVAGGAASAEVFTAIAGEVARVLGVPLVALWRYEADGTSSVLGAWSEREHPFEAGSRWPPAETIVVARVRDTGRPTRIDDFSSVHGTVADAVREIGVRSGAGAPIVVDGQIWGAIAAAGTQLAPLPDRVEDQLADFTELVATAISTTTSREELAGLAEEQSALRRVATLVAQSAPPDQVFALVAEQVARVLDVPIVGIARYEDDGTISARASVSPRGELFSVGTRWPVEGTSAVAQVLESGRPARYDDSSRVIGAISETVRRLGIRSSVGIPIVVAGRLWGAIVVSSTEPEPLPEDTEERLSGFTELLATAISTTEARTEVERLAEEQAALRRVATLVARQSKPAEVFRAVAEEVGRLLGMSVNPLYRYEGDFAVVMASCGDADALIPVGTRMPLDGDNIAVRIRRGATSVRIDDSAQASGAIGEQARRLGIRSGVGTPIMVEGRLWGGIVATSRRPEPPPPDTESRIAQFTELVATAISNTEARSELAASRARVVAAADDERRRVVRDLHDGAQQRLVHTVLTLKLAAQALQDAREPVPAWLTEALLGAQQATHELRELSHGILPAVLSRGGLRPAVRGLSSRTPVPVEIDVSVGRLPAAVEATAYFVVAEALTNVAKHARARRASVTASVTDGVLRVVVRDDGVGGARSRGSGLLGLADRLAALDGRLEVDSQPNRGTVVTATIPIPA